MRLGRVTLGLYNSYDATRWAEAHRRALARAAPVALAYEMHLAAFGFPFHKLRPETAPEEVEKARPEAIAEWVAAGTTIGEDGSYFVQLARQGHFHPEPFPRKGFPPQYGTAVLATRKPWPERRATTGALASLVREGQGLLLLVGLGPHGVPEPVFEAARHHWDLTGKGLSLETATAIGAAAATLHADIEARGPPRTPLLTVDGIVGRVRNGQREIVLIRRANPPHQGAWVLPGGFVDVGETAERAALREVEEETGLQARITGLVGVYSDPGRDPRAHTSSVTYAMEAEGDREPRGSSDAREARYWPLDALPRLGFDHERIVADYRRVVGA